MVPDLTALWVVQVGALIAVGTGIIEPSVIANLLVRGSSHSPGLYYT